MITAAGNGFSDAYTYDGDGRRVKKSDGTLYWVDDNFQPLSIGTASGLTKDFVFLGGKRIAFVSLASGNAYYYLSDHLGSTAVIASGDGKAIQWDADYYPFGNQRDVFTSSVNNPYQFTGDEYDSDTQFDYSVARFEAGRWGRFLSPDPYIGSMDMGNPQTLNRYSYVLNNPIRFTDTLGLDNDCGGPCTPFVADMIGDCALVVSYHNVVGADGNIYNMPDMSISCPMPGDQGMPNVSSRPAMPQRKTSGDSKFVWAINFTKSFFNNFTIDTSDGSCLGAALDSYGPVMNAARKVRDYSKDYVAPLMTSLPAMGTSIANAINSTIEFGADKRNALEMSGAISAATSFIAEQGQAAVTAVANAAKNPAVLLTAADAALLYGVANEAVAAHEGKCHP